MAMGKREGRRIKSCRRHPSPWPRDPLPPPFFLIHSLKTENVSDVGLARPGFSLALLVTGRVTLGKSFAKDYRRAGAPRPATRVTLKPHREDKTGKKGVKVLHRLQIQQGWNLALEWIKGCFLEFGRGLERLAGLRDDKRRPSFLDRGEA